MKCLTPVGSKGAEQGMQSLFNEAPQMRKTDLQIKIFPTIFSLPEG